MAWMGKVRKAKKRPIIEVDENKLRKAKETGDLREVREDLDRQAIEADRVSAGFEEVESKVEEGS